MSARGPYAKGVAKRREILDAALRVIAEHGYSGATVKQIADEVGLSQNGLLHYFGSKDSLLIEVLRHRDERDSVTYRGVDDSAKDRTAEAPGGRTLDDLKQGLSALVRHNSEVPGVVQLFARLTADASEAEHSAHPFLADRYRSLREESTRWISFLQERGEIRRDIDPAQVAVMLFALIDGLQNQWMYEESIDMAVHVEAFFELLRPRS